LQGDGPIPPSPPQGGPTMQCQTCTCCGFFYTGSAKGELGGREAQGNAGVPSELSSFASDGVGGLRQEGRQNYEGQVCHRATDRKAKTGQASVGFQGDLHEDGEVGRAKLVSTHQRLAVYPRKMLSWSGKVGVRGSAAKCEPPVSGSRR